MCPSAQAGGEWHPEAFTCQAFNAECHPVGFKDGGLACRCWVSRVMNGDMIREVESEVVTGGIEQWRDRWGMGRWVKNKSWPSHPSSSVRWNTVFSHPLLCLTPCMAIFFVTVSQPPPLSFFPLSVGSTADSLHIPSSHNIPEVFVWDRETEGINIACCIYVQSDQNTGCWPDRLRVGTATGQPSPDMLILGIIFNTVRSKRSDATVSSYHRVVSLQSNVFGGLLFRQTRLFLPWLHSSDLSVKRRHPFSHPDVNRSEKLIRWWSLCRSMSPGPCFSHFKLP